MQVTAAAAKDFPFDVVCITAPNSAAASAFLTELRYRFGEEVYTDGEEGKTIVLCSVADPTGARVGSGGGTLNALNALSQAPGVVEAGGLSTRRSLMVHSGGDSQRSPSQCVCGKAWSSINSLGRQRAFGPCVAEGSCGGQESREREVPNTPMDLLLRQLSRLFGPAASELTPGSLVIACCDVMLLLPDDISIDWSHADSSAAVDIAGLAIAADASYAPNHGVYVFSAANIAAANAADQPAAAEAASLMQLRPIEVQEYLQKPSMAAAMAAGAILPDGRVAVDTGLMLCRPSATAALAALAAHPALAGCTSRGAAAGVPPLRLELYSDILLALAGAGGPAAAAATVDPRLLYLERCGGSNGCSGGSGGRGSGGGGSSGGGLSREAAAREEVWKLLGGQRLGGVLLSAAQCGFAHLGTTAELLDMAAGTAAGAAAFWRTFDLAPQVASSVADSVMVASRAAVVNCRLSSPGAVGAGALVEHCRFDAGPKCGGRFAIGPGCLASGLRSLPADLMLVLDPGMCVQETSVESRGAGAFVLAVFHVTDDIKRHVGDPKATVCGATWATLLCDAQCSSADIWPGLPEAQRTLWQAKLFPILRQPADVRMSLWLQWLFRERPTAATTVLARERFQAAVAAGDVLAWKHAERLSFRDILAAADPVAEFAWRRELALKNVAVSATSPEIPQQLPWDLVCIVTRSMCQFRCWSGTLQSLSSGQGALKPPLETLCIPPADPDTPCPRERVVATATEAATAAAKAAAAAAPAAEAAEEAAAVAAAAATTTAAATGVGAAAAAEAAVAAAGNAAAAAAFVSPTATGYLTLAAEAAAPHLGAPCTAAEMLNAVLVMAEHLSARRSSFHGTSTTADAAAGLRVAVFIPLGSCCCGHISAKATPSGATAAVKGQRLLSLLREWGAAAAASEAAVWVLSDGGSFKSGELRKGLAEADWEKELGECKCNGRDGGPPGVMCIHAPRASKPQYADIKTDVDKTLCEIAIGVVLDAADLRYALSLADGNRHGTYLGADEGRYAADIPGVTTRGGRCSSLPGCSEGSLACFASLLGEQPGQRYCRLVKFGLQLQLQPRKVHRSSCGGDEDEDVVLVALATAASGDVPEAVAGEKLAAAAAAVAYDKAMSQSEPLQALFLAVRSGQGDVDGAAAITAILQLNETASAGATSAASPGVAAAPAGSSHSPPGVCLDALLTALEEAAAAPDTPPAGVARALALCGLALFLMAEARGGGGHRSGPGRHLSCSAASAAGPTAAVEALRKARRRWLAAAVPVEGEALGSCVPSPHLMVRLARHYEAAAQDVVSRAVGTAAAYVKANRLPIDKVPQAQLCGAGSETSVAAAAALSVPPAPGSETIGPTFVVDAAARIDLAGGWTDTPPICYEAGGAVVNAAVTIDGERPLRATATRISEPVLELVCEHFGSAANISVAGSPVAHTVATCCRRVADLADMCLPHAPAALLKAAAVVAGLVDDPAAASAGRGSSSGGADSGSGGSSLAEQLARSLGSGGMRITSRSFLPTGSGMGGSSILAGAVLSAISRAAGAPLDEDSLVHGVLLVEQLLTTGGGWQDQVGGIFGGLKLTTSDAALPLHVAPSLLQPPAGFAELLSEHLVLVFSGKQRLARDLLQTVLRGWHARTPKTVAAVTALRRNASDAAAAVRAGDLAAVGRCLSEYWELKKGMAPGAEPPHVAALMAQLRPLSLGLCGAGAGGGGFITCIMAEGGDVIKRAEVALEAVAKSFGPDVRLLSVHRAAIDPQGMSVS